MVRLGKVEAVKKKNNRDKRVASKRALKVQAKREVKVLQALKNIKRGSTQKVN